MTPNYLLNANTSKLNTARKRRWEAWEKDQSEQVEHYSKMIDELLDERIELTRDKVPA
jgi:hypothetical protein